jgi:DNA repair exonuclease SbcCD nuclease subunit
MGDWHENRNALNISTLTYSYEAGKLLNALGLPIFFCIGNHDLYHRHTRELYSVIPFHEFTNFVVVNEPLLLPNMGEGTLISPYLFSHEYPDLVKYLELQTWWGHFEFKDFVVTGYNITMPTGPDPIDFAGPTIFSGHFHKRQSKNNIHYIGNTFPMDFSDAGQTDRGMVVYDHTTGKINYKNWAECPKYAKVRLTEILDDTTSVPTNARIKCIIDVPISYEESSFLKQKFIDDFQLREFAMEESQDIVDALKGDVVELGDDVKLDSVDDLVIQMINSIDTPHIETAMLAQIYQQLKA